MIQNEIDILRSLDHPNLIKLDSVYQTTSSYYMVLELFSGGNLKEYVKEKGALPENQATFILKNLLEAVKSMHDKNIMHRDIKPENILFRSFNIMEPNQIALADLGLATFNDVSEYLFPRCGTPGYVAPEIYSVKGSKQHYSLKCDLFSVGVTFYYMLTGGLPYSGDDDLMCQNKECEIDFFRFKKFDSLSKQSFFFDYKEIIN